MSTGVDMNHTSMASLFDIEPSLDDLNESDDYVASDSKPITSFEKKCEDIKSLMISEAKTDSEIIIDAMNAPAPVNATVQIDSEIPELIKTEPVKTKSKNKTSAETDIESKQEIEQLKNKEDELDIPDTVNQEDSNNPLNLNPDDLKVYNKIKEKTPQFMLYNGSRVYKDFYRYKFLFLKTALSRFKVLDLGEMTQELRDIKLDHYIDADTIHPDLIRVKLNEAYKWRVRVASLLIHAFEQFYAWRRWLDMMRAKLWKDHALKGAYNRDGLTLEHLYDIEQYVHDMEGFIESAKHFDNMLKAASDSLSRQLTCLQLKEHHGLANSDVKSKELIEPDLDGLDSVDSNSVISAPKVTGAPHPIDFGVNFDESDEISRL